MLSNIYQISQTYIKLEILFELDVRFYTKERNSSQFVMFSYKTQIAAGAPFHRQPAKIGFLHKRN